MKVFSVSLGTREIGVAILNQGQLIHWQTHSFHGVWSDEKLEAILKRCDRYIIQYRVGHVVIKIPPITHLSKTYLTLLKRLSDLVQERDCMVACNTKADLKGMVSDITNPQTLMSYVTLHHPILLPEQAQELAAKRPYHIKMFEAVLAGMLYKQQLFEDNRS
jgi:hypothetical protein